MLEWMQKHKKYLVITVWISVIALVFAMVAEWGHGGFFSGSSNRIAKVGDKDISANDYNRMYQEIYRNLPSWFDTKNQERIPELEDEAFRQLARDALLESLADDLYVSVGANEIFTYISNLPEFKNARGQFDREQYLSLLRANGRKPLDFEHAVAKQILYANMQNFPMFPTSTLELNSALSANRIKDDISIIAISKESMLKDKNIAVSESDVMSFWEKNKAKYINPAKYKIAYIAMNFADLKISDNDLEDFYNKNISQYRPDTMQNDRDTLIADYKKSYATAAFSYLSSIQDKLSQMAKDSSFSNVISSVDSNSLKSLLTDKADVKVSFAELSDNDMLRYSGLIEQIIDGNGLLAPIEYGNDSWIVPYVLQKIPSAEMSFEQAKERVKTELLNQKQDSEFKKIANERLKSKDYNLVHIGVVSQNLLSSLDSLSSVATNLAKANLSNTEMKQFLYNIVIDNRKEGVVFVGDKAIFYKINSQNMPGYSELINASNDETNAIDEQKTRDMRNALFDYAAGQYKIIDYRSRN